MVRECPAVETDFHTVKPHYNMPPIQLPPLPVDPINKDVSIPDLIINFPDIQFQFPELPAFPKMPELPPFPDYPSPISPPGGNSQWPSPQIPTFPPPNQNECGQGPGESGECSFEPNYPFYPLPPLTPDYPPDGGGTGPDSPSGDWVNPRDTPMPTPNPDPWPTSSPDSGSFWNPWPPQWPWPPWDPWNPNYPDNGNGSGASPNGTTNCVSCIGKPIDDYTGTTLSSYTGYTAQPTIEFYDGGAGDTTQFQCILENCCSFMYMSGVIPSPSSENPEDCCSECNGCIVIDNPEEDCTVYIEPVCSPGSYGTPCSAVRGRIIELIYSGASTGCFYRICTTRFIADGDIGGHCGCSARIRAKLIYDAN